MNDILMTKRNTHLYIIIIFMKKKNISNSLFAFRKVRIFHF